MHQNARERLAAPAAVIPSLQAAQPFRFANPSPWAGLKNHGPLRRRALPHRSKPPRLTRVSRFALATAPLILSSQRISASVGPCLLRNLEERCLIGIYWYKLCG